ncbi:hypothetical protein ATANTOWER_030536 [Ataeniobius toweri]|uniref:Peptidoglycan binding-like domain-containing protein n=1 Tax=Ataeniobius toweri TaxID=208326 RepID=A0ABU7BWC3_9TELE|nr:hypothetical protein [Ataeniobius toweri]
MFVCPSWYFARSDQRGGALPPPAAFRAAVRDAGQLWELSGTDSIFNHEQTSGRCAEMRAVLTVCSSRHEPPTSGGNMRRVWVLAVTALLAAYSARASPLLVDPEDFLEKYGYLHREHQIHNAVEVQSAIREYQWLSRLPITGQLDSATLRQMAEPRCGVSDEGTQQVWANRVNVIFTGKRLLHHRRRRSADQGNAFNLQTSGT